MNQKERMLANLPYKAWLDGLSEERLENKKRIYEYNNLPPEEYERQTALIDLYSKLAAAEREIAAGAQGEDFTEVAQALRGQVHGQL